MLVAGQAMANGFRNPPEGASALGRVGGKVALVDDATAVSHNPANMAEASNLQVMAAATILRTETEFTSARGSTTTDDPWKILPNFFATFPIVEGQFAGGLGITTPFGQSSVWDRDSIVGQMAPYMAQMTLVNANPSLAAKLGDRLAVGAGVDVYWSRLELKQNLPFGRLRAKGEGEGVGGNVGVTLKVTPKQSLALTYRSPVSVNYNGDTGLDVVPPAARMQGITPNSDFDTDIEFPAVAVAGYGVQLTDSLKVEADVEWVQFSRYDALTLDSGNNNPLLHPVGDPTPAMAPLTIRQDWKDIWTIGGGADWTFAEGWTFRAGYIYLPSPVPEETLAPTLPDANRHVVSVGLGFKRNQHALDLAYGLSLIEDRNIQSNQNPAFNGKYETTSQLFGVAYGYSF
jgi:long-chain fatty acid transport protein